MLNVECRILKLYTMLNVIRLKEESSKDPGIKIIIPLVPLKP
jgi:hypothetical protein